MAVDPTIKQRLVEVAYRRIATQIFPALRSLVTPAALCSDAGVSRDTAYRAFRREPGDDPRAPEGADAVLEAVAVAMLNGDVGDRDRQLRLAVAAFDDARRQGLGADAEIEAALAATFSFALTWDAIPIVFAFGIAGMSESLRRPSEGDAKDATAERVVELHRGAMDRTDRTFAPLLQEGMASRRLRPSGDVSVEVVLALMHALFDGALLRNVIDPGLLSPELIARAILELGLAMTEPGSHHDDPRRPPDDPNCYFDSIVAAAERSWRRNATIDPDRLEDAAGEPIPRQMVQLIFPSVADLADSVVRAMVIGGAALDSTVPTGLTLAHLREMLRRLNDASTTVPAAIALLNEPPGRGTPFLSDLERDIMALLALPALRIPSPERTAKRLVQLALAGPEGWTGVDAVLDLLVIE